MNRSVLLGAVFAFTIAIQSAPHAQSPAQGAVSGPVAAVVNGVEILSTDVAVLYKSLPPQYKRYPLEALRQQLLDRLIDQKLVAGAARKEGLLDDPKVRRRIASVTEGVIQQIYMERLIKEKVTEGAMRTAYEQSKTAGSGEVEVHARHILVKSEATARAIIKDLQGGADFAKMASEKSTGPSKRKGGDLGFFGRGQMVPAFSAAAFKLKPGEFTTRPVKTRFGWHIIKVEGRRAAGMRSFEESRDEIRNALVDQLVRKTVGQLRAKADVKMLQGGGIQRVP